MGVGCRGHFGAGAVDMAMDGKGRAVEQPLPLHDLAVVINANEIGNAHLFERPTHGIDPKGLAVDGVANCDMAGNTLIKAKFPENPQCRRQTLLAELPLLLGGPLDTVRARQHLIRGIHNQFVDLLVHGVSSPLS